jgi:hypothetical protein
MAGEEQRTDKSLALTDERHGGLRQAWESQTAFKISGGFLLVLAALGIWVAISGKPGTTTTAHAPAAPAQRQVIIGSTTPTSTTNNATTSCSLPAGNQSVPANGAPAGMSEGQVGSMSVPEAPQTYGPQHDDGTWAWCFAHNPTGALLAAANFYAEGTAAAPAEVLERFAADTPTKTAAVASERGVGAGWQGANGPVQMVGYKYGSYTGSEAEISLLFTGPGSAANCVAEAVTMLWSQGDWRYVIPAGEQLAKQIVSCSDSTYVSLGGLS